MSPQVSDVMDVGLDHLYPRSAVGRVWCVLLNWWYTITNMVRTIIKRYSSPVPWKILSRQLAHITLLPLFLPPAHKTIPVIIKDWVVTAGAAEMRETGRHERSSSETWYYQLLPENIRDTAQSNIVELTITQSAHVTSLPVVPVLPLSRFPTNCGPKARYEHQISETRVVDGRHRAGTELLGPGSGNISANY